MISVTVSGHFRKKLVFTNASGAVIGRAQGNSFTNGLQLMQEGETRGFQINKAMFSSEIKVLTTGSKHLFSARKPSMFKQMYVIPYKETFFEIHNPAFTLRTFEFYLGEHTEILGTLSSKSLFSKKWDLDLPAEIPEWYQCILFGVCHVIYTNRIQKLA